MGSNKNSYLHHALEAFEWHVEQYNRNYRDQERLPKNFNWRPYRFCVQDVILGLVAVKHVRKGNYLEVDVCLATDVNIFPPLSGVKVVTSFILSEAFKCGGSMEIRFTFNVQGGRVPTEICSLAYEHGIKLKHIWKGHITPAEARELYLAVTDFSQPAVEKIKQLAVETELSPERVCYMAHHGIWTVGEIESILLGSTFPNRLLLGDSVPELRHLFLTDLVHARAALLGGFLDRKLELKERGDESQAVELEGDQRIVDIEFDPRYYAKVYQSEEQLPVPWLQNAELTIPPGEQLVVMVRARNSADLELNFAEDCKTASEMVQMYQTEADRKTHYCSIVPRDIEELTKEQRDGMRKTAELSGTNLIICPETVRGLDEDATWRLERSRTLRR